MKTCTLLSICLVLCQLVMAQIPGELDSDFSGDGIFIENWSDTSTGAFCLGIQPDGNAVIAGFHRISSPATQENIMALRLTGEGNQDMFGNFSRGFDHDLDQIERATSIKVLPDNKILLAGWYMNTIVYQPFVMRLLPDGQIDETFAIDGIFTQELLYMQTVDMDVYFTEDSYNIVLAGVSNGGNPQIIMINQAGNLVTTFNSTGIYEFTATPGAFSDITIDNQTGNLYGSIAYSGMKTALVKINLPEGGLDATFGDGGILSSESFESIDLRFNKIVFEADSGLLTAFGEYRHAAGDLDMCALRVNSSDGNVDNSFGVNGWAWLRNADSDESLQTAIQQSDGKYYFGGYTNYYGTDDFMLGRLNYNGTIDNVFGSGGFIIHNYASIQHINDLALSPSEATLYAIGNSIETADISIVMTAYHTAYIPEAVVNASENIKHSFTWYPNPVTEKLTLETGMTGTHHVVIYDVAGASVWNGDFTGDRIDLNLGFLPQSVYLLQIVMPDKTVRTCKILKQ